MKKIILALTLSVLATASHAQEVKVTAFQKIDLELGIKAVQRASQEKNPFLACIHYRTALLHLSSVEKHMVDTVNKVRVMEQKICKLAGV